MTSGEARRAVLAGAALVLVIAGCGGSGNKSAGTQSSGTQSSSTVAAAPQSATTSGGASVTGTTSTTTTKSHAKPATKPHHSAPKPVTPSTGSTTASTRTTHTTSTTHTSAPVTTSTAAPKTATSPAQAPAAQASGSGPMACLARAGLQDPRRQRPGVWQAVNGAGGASVFVDGPYKSASAASASAQSLAGVETAEGAGRYVVSATLRSHLAAQVHKVATCLHASTSGGSYSF